MPKTAILFSGTAYNFKYSISSIFENFVIPNDADVFILTERFNMRRKAPSTDNVSPVIDSEWHEKTTTIIRDESQNITQEDEQLIKDTFGEKLKGLYFSDDMPEYMDYLKKERYRMMDVVNEYRKENFELKLPMPFGTDVFHHDNGNLKCVIDQYNHVKKCYELMEQYESEHNFKYDYIVRARLDVIVPKQFDISQYYLGQDYPYLYVLGSFRRDPFEWADEFCWFSRRDIAAKLFPNLNKMGFITDRKYNKVYLPQNNDYTFAPETQFSLLLYELNLQCINIKIYRSAKFTNGNDGFDYMNYMLYWGNIQIHYEYDLVCKGQSDINEHLPTLKEYAEKCKHITELGTRYGNSTIAFMAANPKKFISYDVAHNPRIDYLKEIAKENHINFEFRLENPNFGEIEETDLLFIDTNHHAEQCSLELSLHADKAKKYIIFHDTTSFWLKGQGHESGGGLKYAIEPFLENNPQWKKVYHVENNNGLMILERQN